MRLVNDKKTNKEERKGVEIVATSRGRFIYECSCGASNGGHIKNLNVADTLYECGKCNKGVLVTTILERYRIAREVREGKLHMYISQGL